MSIAYIIFILLNKLRLHKEIQPDYNMKLGLALLARLTEGYSGICRLLPSSRYVTGIKSAWHRTFHGEQPTLQIDFDNGSKFDDFALNDETYLLLHFNQDYGIS